MSTEEQNKLIAEFMQIPKCDRCVDCDHFKFGFGIYSLPKDMEYHSSWDWLMPVVEKIMTHRYPDYYGTRGRTEDDGEYDDCAHFRTFGMRDKEGNYMVRINACGLFHAPTLIESTYLAVVDFIQSNNILTNKYPCKRQQKSKKLNGL